MLAGLMTKLKRPRQASSSSSAARKKEPPRKGAIPAKRTSPAAKAASKAAPAKAGKAGKPAAASKAAKKKSTKPAKALASGGRTAATSSKAAANKAAANKAAKKKPSKTTASSKATAGKTSKAASSKATASSKAASSHPTASSKPAKAARPATGGATGKEGAKTAARSAKSASAAARSATRPAAGKTSSQLALPLAAVQAGRGRAAEDRDGSADEEVLDEEAESSSDDDESEGPAPESPRKRELKALLHDALEQQLTAARVAHHAAVEGATHEEARPENDKDTRGLEQSYLARGHAQRVADLEAGLVSLAEMSVLEVGDGAPIALGAIVKIDDGDHLRSFLLAPAGGGMVLPGDITVLTPTSPIGRALLGRGVDDECEVGSGAHARTLTIVAVE